MPERATVAQGVQIGVETTPGVAVAANRRLTSLSFDIGPTLEFEQFRPFGNKFATLSLLNQDWSEADMEGALTYTEIVYVLSSLFDTATITTPAGGTLSRQWEFEINPTGADSPKTLTVETGDATLAEKIAGLIINALTLEVSRTDGVSLSGEGFGRSFQTGQTLTASPVTIPLVPVMPGHFSIYLDEVPEDPEDSETTFGTTKLTRASSFEMEIGDRYSPFWAVDSAQGSFAATIEGAPDATATLTLMADSVGTGLLTDARAGTTFLLRLEAVGPVIEDTINYRFTVDMAVKVTEVGGREDEDNAQVIPYGLGIMYDPGWEKAIRIQVVNTLTAL